MNPNRNHKKRIRLKKKQALYTLGDNHTVYYPKTGGAWMTLPFLMVGAGFFMLINQAFASMFEELTWEMFFSFQMVGMTFIWLMFSLPMFLFLYGIYSNLALVSLSKEPILVLTPEGMYHRHDTQIKQEFVAWSEIKTIWVRPKHLHTRNKRIKLCITLKAIESEVAPVVWVDFRSAQCEEYTLYQNVLKYWRQYRGDDWQGCPNTAETGWIN